METTRPRFPRIRQFRTAALKCLFLYLLAPCLLLVCFGGAISDAAMNSESAAFRILLGALGAVGLNWAVYAVIRRKRPSLLVFAYGTFLLFVTVALQYLALPGYYPLVSTLAIIGVTLLQAVLILLSFWFASLKTKPACAAAVTIRVIVGIFLVLMAIEIVNELENGLVNGYTWLTLSILIALLMGLFSPKIAASLRRSLSRRRKTDLVTGQIVRIVGTTHLDPEDELITLFHAHILYTDPPQVRQGSLHRQRIPRSLRPVPSRRRLSGKDPETRREGKTKRG